MAVSIAPSLALGAGALAAAGAYLNAKYHLLWDLQLATLAPTSRATTKFVTERVTAKRLFVFDLLEDQARHNGHRTFLVFEGQSWTYEQFYNRIIQAANWLLHDLKIQKDEIVALYGTNTPEYIILWFALDCIGAVPSYINCNLTEKSLLHCVTLCKSRYLLHDADSTANIATCESGFRENGVQTILYSPDTLNALPPARPLPEADKRRQAAEFADLKNLIYTSGTTGLPKATRLTVQRDLLTGHTVSRFLHLKEGDRMFTCLPLYHGAAHGLCITPAICAGSTVVLSRRFSHKTFWPEVCASKANIIQYVGELCRYLVNAPPSPLDKAHNVRMAWGNGMRSDVWEPFRQRFGIECINELYAATDTLGAGSFNPNRGEYSKHAIAVRGLLWRTLAGRRQKYVRVDMDSQEVVRDEKTGFAIECKPDEPGEEVYLMDPSVALDDLYYGNTEAREKRLLRNCFRKGDVWFRSGDMHRMDASGRVYFVDRLGDTYRWRSENVSTNEVSDVVGSFPQIEETNVIGVTVPAADGRCGCAAIVMKKEASEQTFDFKGLAEHCLKQLPRYAVPGFIRVTALLEYTGTFKIQKGRLRQEGIDPDKVTGGDHIYWLPAGENAYRPFSKGDYEALKNGTARV